MLDLLVEMGPDHSPWFPGGLVADLEDLLGASGRDGAGGAAPVSGSALAEAKPL